MIDDSIEVPSAQTEANAAFAAAHAAASNLGAVLGASASSVATAVQADAERLAVKDEHKAEGWAHREWDALKAKMHAVLAEMEAYVKAKL